MSKVVAIIPVRGGSKAIPRKNVKDFCGKPLLTHIIQTALQVQEIDRVIVSTDDDEIAAIARMSGAEVPFMRPSELAEDETPTLPVLLHAIKHLEEEEGYKPDVIVLLYPTSPLVTPFNILNAIVLKDMGYDSVVSVVEDYKHYWIASSYGYERVSEDATKNRQYATPLLKEDGAIYITTRHLLESVGEILGGKIGFLHMFEDLIDIDTPLDFEIAELMMKKRQENG